MEVKERISWKIIFFTSSLTELPLHACQLLFFLFDFLSEMSILIFEKVEFGYELGHLNIMFFPGVFQGCHCDVFACDEIFHVHGGIRLFFRG